MTSQFKNIFAYSLSHKTNRFHVAVRLSSNWSKKTFKCDMAFVKCYHFFLSAWLLKTRSRCWGYNFTNILQEFVRVLREKKPGMYYELIKSAYITVMQVRILLETSRGILVLPKSLWFLIVFVSLSGLARRSYSYPQ